MPEQPQMTESHFYRPKIVTVTVDNGQHSGVMFIEMQCNTTWRKFHRSLIRNGGIYTGQVFIPLHYIHMMQPDVTAAMLMNTGTNTVVPFQPKR